MSVFSDLHRVAVEHACMISGIPYPRVTWSHMYVNEIVPRSSTCNLRIEAYVDEKGSICSSAIERSYHNRTHVAEVWAYSWPRSQSDPAWQRQALAAFAVTHDWFYLAQPEYPGQSEALSIDALHSFGEKLEPKAFAFAVQGVLASAKHTEYQRGLPTVVQLMLDADLHGLGSPWSDYINAAESIRAELAPDDDAAWYSGRTTFLEKMLTRPRIFYTEEAWNNLELAALQNMRQELGMLRRQK